MFPVPPFSFPGTAPLRLRCFFSPVPGSMFPVPPFSFPGYRPAPLGFAASGRAAGALTGGLFPAALPGIPPVGALAALPGIPPVGTLAALPGIPPVGALAALGREFLLTPACPVGVPLFLLPGPGFHVPCSRFRRFLSCLLATGYRLQATGLPRWGYFEIYYCTITTVLTMTYCWGWIAGIRQIFTRILLQIMPPVVQC